MISPLHELSNRKWIALASHRTWLLREAEKLFSFFERRIINPLGGFYALDDEGRPAAPGYGAADRPARYLFATSRIIHAYTIAHLMGRPARTSLSITESIFCGMATATRSTEGTIGMSAMMDHRIPPSRRTVTPSFSWPRRVPRSQATQAPIDSTLISSTLVREQFWEEQSGAVVEEFTRDWQPFDSYRGQNSNMHLTESLMAAFEATNDSTYLRMAERIADLIIGRQRLRPVGGFLNILLIPGA